MIKLLLLLSSVLSFAKAPEVVGNPMYGYDALLVKENYQKAVNLQDVGYFYVVARPIKMKTIGLDHPDIEPFEIEESTIIYIGKVNGDWVNISIISPNDSGEPDVPVQMWVAAKRLWKSRLIKIGSSLGFMDEVLGHQIKSPLTIKHQVISENRSRRRKRVLRCYRYVKEFLLSQNLVNNYLPGESARSAAHYLKKHGYKQVMGPRSSPVGSVCVYRGGWHNHGHIEVKRGAQCWWYGYGCKKRPVQRRKLIGCYYKGWAHTSFAPEFANL